jgi:hypothetical protein
MPAVMCLIRRLQTDVLKWRSDTGAIMATSLTRELRLQVRQPDMIGPAVGAGLDVMAAVMIAAVDQDIADAGLAQLAEGEAERGLTTNPRSTDVGITSPTATGCLRRLLAHRRRRSSILC